MEKQFTIRCNNCYKYFKDDDNLLCLLDADGYFLGCPNCKTDEYLMDGDWDNYIDLTQLSQHALGFRVEGYFLFDHLFTGYPFTL